MEQATIKEKPIPRRRRWQYSLRALMLVVTVVALLFAGVKSYIYYYMKWKYPYGWSHVCDIELMFALQRYADDHGGRYPTGGATPEASLCLLYTKYTSAFILRGKTVPLDVAEKILQQGKPLGPTTCGWHYVDEGLTINDDSQIALFWDKIGLDHNGGRLPEGGHSVVFPHHGEVITEKEWPAFLEKQKKLLAPRKRKPASPSQSAQKPVSETNAP
jgi:hypothetical protein